MGPLPALDRKHPNVWVLQHVLISPVSLASIDWMKIHRNSAKSQWKKVKVKSFTGISPSHCPLSALRPPPLPLTTTSSSPCSVWRPLVVTTLTIGAWWNSDLLFRIWSAFYSTSVYWISPICWICRLLPIPPSLFWGSQAEADLPGFKNFYHIWFNPWPYIFRFGAIIFQIMIPFGWNIWWWDGCVQPLGRIATLLVLVSVHVWSVWIIMKMDLFLKGSKVNATSYSLDRLLNLTCGGERK